MGYDRFCGKAHPNVAADLTHPHEFALELHRCQPQTQVVAFVNRVACLLHGSILAPAKDIQGADGRVTIVPSKKKRYSGLPGRTGSDGFRLVPSGPHKGMIYIFTASDDDKVEGVARFGSVSVDRAARQLLEVLNEAFFIFEIFPCVCRIKACKIDLVVIDFQAGHGNEKRKGSYLPVFSHQIDDKRFGALVQVGEHKPSSNTSLMYVDILSVFKEVMIHLPVGGV